MRILLDEDVPRRLGPLLIGHESSTVPQSGWAGIKNGKLFALAATLRRVHHDGPEHRIPTEPGNAANCVSAPTSMSKNDKVIRSGPFKGKKITFASTGRVEEFKTIADDFMLDVFELEPGDYAISDESDLRDFASFIEEDRVDAWKRMREHYGLKREELQSTLLIDVFEEIANRRKLQ